MRHVLISTVYLFSDQHNLSLFVLFSQSHCIMEVLSVCLLQQVAVETHTDSGSRLACHWRLSAGQSDWLADSLMVFTYFGTNLGHLITTTVSSQRRQRLRCRGEKVYENEPEKRETIQEEVNRATKRLQWHYQLTVLSEYTTAATHQSICSHYDLNSPITLKRTGLFLSASTGHEETESLEYYKTNLCYEYKLAFVGLQ